MKNMILAVMLAAAPAAAQEFASDMAAAGGILAGTRALKAAAASEKTINAELWKARQACRAEPDPARRALLRAEYDRRLDEILAASDKELDDRAPGQAAAPRLNRELWDCRRAYRTEPDPERKARLRDRCDRALDETLSGADRRRAAP